MEIFTSLVGVLLVLGVILAGLLMLVAPARAHQLLKRLGLAVVVWFLALVVIGELGRLLSPWMLVAAAGASLFAYWVRTRQRQQSARGLRGVERQPLMPQHLDDEEER
jgi:hypothetical protein